MSDLTDAEIFAWSEGEQRNRNAMQESAQHHCSLCIVVTVLIVAAAAFVAWTWYVAGPPPFFNWSK